MKKPHCDQGSPNENTIGDGCSTVLYFAYTVDTVENETLDNLYNFLSTSKLKIESNFRTKDTIDTR